MSLPKSFGIIRGWPLGGGQVVVPGDLTPPAGFVFLTDASGKYFIDANGAYFVKAI